MIGREGWLTLRGRDVRFREAGAGHPIVLVHGLGLSSDFWAPHYRALAGSGFRAVAPDLPGFGRSSGPRFGLSVEETARWLLEFADALALARPAWLGHSLGAQPVLDLAARSPHRTDALVLAAPTGSPGQHRSLRQFLAVAADVAREPASLIPAVARAYVATSPLNYIGTWLKAGRDHPIDKARRVRCPTLILIGRSDPLVPPSYVELLRRRIPDARVARVSRGAHAIVFDAVVEFDRIVTRFLRDTLS